MQSIASDKQRNPNAGRGPFALWLLGATTLLGACDGKTVTLGHANESPIEAGAQRDSSIVTETDAASFRLPQIGVPELVSGIASDSKDDNPTLTNDLLEIYFSSTRSGNADVWFATRPDTESDFGEPQPIPAVNTPEFDSSPAINSDGLTLWVGRNVEDGLGGLDIYVSRRPSRGGEWSEPVLVAELSSSEDDIPRPPGAGGFSMPLASRVDSADYRTYLATRNTLDGEFGKPRLLQELLTDDSSTVDGFLTWDGAALFFTHSSDEQGDLFVAPAQGQTFGRGVALDSVNTASDERDPWVSPDGSWLYFASDRDGTLHIYQAPIEW